MAAFHRRVGYGIALGLCLGLRLAHAAAPDPDAAMRAALRDFGVEGAWAVSCVAAPGPYNPHFRFRIPEAGDVTVEQNNGAAPWTDTMIDAKLLPDGRLQTVRKTDAPPWSGIVTSELMHVGDKLRTMSLIVEGTAKRTVELHTPDGLDVQLERGKPFRAVLNLDGKMRVGPLTVEVPVVERCP